MSTAEVSPQSRKSSISLQRPQGDLLWDCSSAREGRAGLAHGSVVQLPVLGNVGGSPCRSSAPAAWHGEGRFRRQFSVCRVPQNSLSRLHPSSQQHPTPSRQPLSHQEGAPFSHWPSGGGQLSLARCCLTSASSLPVWCGAAGVKVDARPLAPRGHRRKRRSVMELLP